MNLAAFESALAGAADAAVTGIQPTGGFATYLQKNPAIAGLFAIAVLSAHTYLSGLEAKTAT
jgi:hypothetical protein